MKLRNIYLILCVLGVLLPYSQFVPFMLENGLNAELFIQEMLANRISRFFVLDVVVSAVVLLVLVFTEGRRLGMKHLWAPVLGIFMVGVSLGLPLFLYLRQLHIEAKQT